MMTPELRATYSLARQTHYFAIMQTTIFSFIALAAIIHFGPQGFSPALAMLVIVTTAYGILAGGTALDDIINLIADLSPDMAETNMGQGIKARNMPMLKMISAVLIGLTGLAELIALAA